MQTPMTITLIQPRYPHLRPQNYLPGGLCNLSSRLMAAGLDTTLLDLNVTTLRTNRETLLISDFVGFTVLGPPYIPRVREDIGELRHLGYTGAILVGGEGVARISAIDFACWFGGLGTVTQIQDDEGLCRALGLEAAMLATEFETSMRPALEKLTEADRRRYLTGEFGLWLSQGCIFKCDYCAAKKKTPEQYRSEDSLRDEIEYICQYLASIGHSELHIYLSNLDIFQNIANLKRSLTVIHEIAVRYRIQPHIRGLATAIMTATAVKADPTLADRLYTLGLRIVGFGADGADMKTWRAQGKRHNNLADITTAIEAMLTAKIQPELLMVFGFQGSSWEQLKLALDYSFAWAKRGVVVRPYLAKSQTPAGGNWDDGSPEVHAFRQNPNRLYSLDYAALGSRWTHPVARERYLANATYLYLIIALTPRGLCTTSPLLPVPDHGIGRWLARTINRFMPHDR